MKWKSMNWKPLKWLLLSLFALIWAFWVSGSYLPAAASPIHQDAFKIGSDITIAEGQTVGDAFAIGGDVTIQENALVQGEAFAIGGNVQLENNTQVEGDVFAIGGRVIRAESAVVNGSEFTLLEGFSGVFDRFGVFGTLYLGSMVFWVVGFVVAAIAGLLLLLLLPNHIDTVSTTISARPLTSLLYGIGGIAVLTLLSVLISGSVLGAILLPLVNLAVLLTCLHGYTAVCVWLGKRLRRQNADAYFQPFWLGLIVLFIISLIPFLGGLLVSLISLFGFGATLLSRYGTQTSATLPKIFNRLEHQTE